MPDAVVRFQRWGTIAKRKCALNVSESCASTFEGDADDKKLAELIEIACIRLFLNDADSIVFHICEPCLQYQVQAGWIETT